MKHKLALAGTFIWVLGVSAFIGMLHSWHYVDYGQNVNTKDLSHFIKKTETYGVLHFVTPLCSCSKVISKHLLQRKPLENILESVVMIDDDHDQFSSRLKDLGYQVFNLSTKTLDKPLAEAIKGVPLLVIYDKQKQVQYLGGYSNSTITPFSQINIEGFIGQLERKEILPSYPVKGCSVSEKYKNLLDPFGIKYAKR